LSAGRPHGKVQWGAGRPRRQPGACGWPPAGVGRRGAADPRPVMITSTFSERAFAGRVVVVTGGGTGIGREIALAFARCGADLVLASRKPDNLERVAAEVRALGRRALAVPTNVREPEACQQMAETAVRELGQIDVLVNNAGANFTCPA